MAKFSKKTVDKILELWSSDTYTIAEVCELVGIAERTFYNWRDRNAEFADALKKAEDKRNQFFLAEAKKSLLKKIQGYTIKEKHTTYVNSTGRSSTGEEIEKPKIKEQKIVEKHFQPDTAAIIFTLTNQDPENWRNRQSTEVTGKDGKDLIPAKTLTKEEARELLRDLENEY
ncbi:phBC6A51 family helix-turn-helix protein [Leadbetterella byssophila]|uniref:phBC6A51 family helix-turn-helix protein n=1 Tax=Leadbetterella byssophila TaxID=316068 RepID=UPI0039A0329E